MAPWVTRGTGDMSMTGQLAARTRTSQDDLKMQDARCKIRDLMMCDVHAGRGARWKQAASRKRGEHALLLEQLLCGCALWYYLALEPTLSTVNVYNILPDYATTYLLRTVLPYTPYSTASLPATAGCQRAAAGYPPRTKHR